MKFQVIETSHNISMSFTCWGAVLPMVHVVKLILGCGGGLVQAHARWFGMNKLYHFECSG